VRGEARSAAHLLEDGHDNVSTMMIYTHVLNQGPAGVTSPADRVLDPSPPHLKGDAR
jgi:hypothetical protein